MKIVLAIYSQSAYQEFLLPSVNNADYKLYLDSMSFSLQKSLTLFLEITDGEWKLLPSDSYTMKVGSYISYVPIVLKDKGILSILTQNEEILYLMVRFEEKILRAFCQYRINGIQRITIGSDPSNDIVYSYNHVISKQHAMLVKKDHAYILFSFSENGAYVNNKLVKKEYQLAYGDYINLLGLKMIFLQDVLAIDTGENQKRYPIVKLKPIEIHREWKGAGVYEDPKGDCRYLYHISPRYEIPIKQALLELKNPPIQIKEEKKSYYDAVGPTLTMSIPMLIGYSMMMMSSASERQMSGYMWSGIVIVVLSSVFSSYWAARTNHQDRVKYEKKNQETQDKYLDYLKKKEEVLKELHDSFRERLYTQYPSAKDLLTTMASARKNLDKNAKLLLWGRLGALDDILLHRIGIGANPNLLQVHYEKALDEDVYENLKDEAARLMEQYNGINEIPILLNYYQYQVIGLAGQEVLWRKVLYAILAQFLYHHNYGSMKLAIFYDPHSSYAEEYDTLRWLPHVWSDHQHIRYVAKDSVEVGEVAFELWNQLKQSESGYEDSDLKNTTYYIIVVTNQELLREEPIWQYLIHKQPSSNFTMFTAAESYKKLPDSCEIVFENFEKERNTIRFVEESRQEEVRFDLLDHDIFRTCIYEMANLRVEEKQMHVGIPDSISFLSMYGVTKLEELDVVSLWKKNRTYDHIEGMLGIRSGGKPCILDVHERYHGPHGLIAGTTGSGKSETLQTYILSLALHYSPEDIGFFLIDYKGGGMAHLFDGLPHMVGEISNLSGSQIQRAMVSIKSENQRRQRLFHEYNVNNINAYTKLYKSGETQQAIPHLFIIVDEFAELKKEEPDFLQQLISVAQVGRSLGVHLILSTQKPSGTVDDNIWSNAKFHICLRVQNRADSMDMLHKADAADITHAGRGYLQVGNDEVYELFQSGYSGAAYEEEDCDLTAHASMLTLHGHEIPIKKKKNPKEKSMSQLEAVIEYLKKQAEQMCMRSPMRLWMPELGDEIFFEELVAEQGSPVLLGMLDDVENQSQYSYGIDLGKSGHIGVIGSVSGGKSTFLQTFVYSVLKTYGPEDVNLYLLDFGSRMLSAYGDAPQVGGIVTGEDPLSLKRVIYMLVDELKRRKKLLAGGSFTQYLASEGNKLPYVLIVIDNYGNFKRQTGEEYEDIFTMFSKDGVNHGILLVISGYRFGMDDITTRIGDNLSTIFCLQLSERYEYMEYFHQNNIEGSPSMGIPGRGMVLHQDRVLEFQTALALRADHDFDRIEKLKEFSRLQNLTYPYLRARGIPSVPDRVIWKIFEQSKEYMEYCQDEEVLLVGYDLELGTMFALPLAKFFVFLIWGEEKCGKTNLMQVLLKAIEHRKTPYLLYQIDGKTEDFIDCKNKLQELIDAFIRRNRAKNAWIDEGYSDQQLYARMREEQPVFVFLMHLSDLIISIRENDIKLYAILINIMEKGALHHIYIFADLSLAQGEDLAGDRILEVMASYETGVHLGGAAIKNRYLPFADLPFEEREKKGRVGDGYLAIGTERTIHVRIPYIRDSSK